MKHIYNKGFTIQKITGFGKFRSQINNKNDNNMVQCLSTEQTQVTYKM